MSSPLPPSNTEQNPTLVDNLIRIWMSLSFISIFPMLYFGYQSATVLFSGDTLAQIQAGAPTPDGLLFDQLAFLGLGLNYVIFKMLCVVTMHPRVGIMASLRSDVRKAEALAGHLDAEPK